MKHVAFALCSALALQTAAAQDPVYPLPEVSNLESLNVRELAARLRDINHSFIDVLPYIRQGRMTRRLRDGNKVHEVTSRNASRWEVAFMARRNELWQEARKKGYRDISGVYAFQMNPPSCILPTPSPTRVVVGQQGHDFIVYLSTQSKLSGVIVKDHVDLPLYGGTQRTKVYFTGMANDQGIRLTNGDACEVELIKK